MNPTLRQFLAQGGWLAAVFFAFGALLLVLALYDGSMARRFDAEGVTVEARVIDRDTRRIRRVNKPDRTSHEVTYLWLYDPPGDRPAQEQRTTRAVPKGIYDAHDPGRRVPLRYLPDDPGSVEVFPGEYRGEMRLLGYLSLALGSLGLVVALSVLHRARRLARIGQDGIARRATVTALRDRKSSRLVTLAFTDAQGREVTASLSLPRGTPTPQPGKTMAIRFDPAAPRWIVPDPAPGPETPTDSV